MNNESKSCEEIIKQVQSQFNGDREHDREIIVKSMHEYAGHPYGQEITRELGRIMWDYLTPEEQEEFKQVIDTEQPIVDMLNETIELANKGDTLEALKVMDEFMNSYPRTFADDQVSEYHSFNNPIEEVLFLKYIPHTKHLREIPLNAPWFDVYFIYGRLLMDNGRTEEAEKMFKEALKINPVSTATLLFLAQINENDLEEYYKYSLEALKYAYQYQEVAESYRKVATYHYKKENYQLAAALYIASSFFESTIPPELEDIHKKGYKTNFEEDELIQTIEENDLPARGNPEVIKTIQDLAEEFEANKDYEGAIFFYVKLMNMTYEMELAEKIGQLKELVEN